MSYQYALLFFKISTLVLGYEQLIQGPCLEISLREEVYAASYSFEKELSLWIRSEIGLINMPFELLSDQTGQTTVTLTARRSIALDFGINLVPDVESLGFTYSISYSLHFAFIDDLGPF